jgi:hypothetical protein
MDMEFLARDNEDHTIAVQHMYCLLLLLLSNHSYLLQVMEPIMYHLSNYFLDSKPGKKKLNYLDVIGNRKCRPQIHLDYVSQYLIQQYKLYSPFDYQLNKQHFVQ